MVAVTPVPVTEHADCPLTLNVPAVNPALYDKLMLALSEVADTMVVFAGLVQR